MLPRAAAPHSYLNRSDFFFFLRGSLWSAAQNQGETPKESVARSLLPQGAAKGTGKWDLWQSGGESLGEESATWSLTCDFGFEMTTLLLISLGDLDISQSLGYLNTSRNRLLSV